MFTARYYTSRMFAPRYFAKVGGSGAAVGRVRATFTSRRPHPTITARRPSATFASRRPNVTFTVEEDA